MRIEIKRLQPRTGTTIVYVTHDQIEAMTLATKIAVLKDGEVQQFGTPAEIYNSPANIFVADFMGSPAMNLIPATIAQQRRCAVRQLQTRRRRADHAARGQRADGPAANPGQAGHLRHPPRGDDRSATAPTAMHARIADRRLP